MRLEQLYSLTEDEMDMLWYIVNVLKPKILKNADLEPRDFVSINRELLVKRVTNSRQFIKEEYFPILDGLISKIGVV